MSVLQSPAAFWMLAAIQVLGLASAWFARLSEGSAGQTTCQWLFFCCLTLVGIATITALQLGPGSWLTSGSTLSLMVLAATCDFSRSGRASVWEGY